MMTKRSYSQFKNQFKEDSLNKVSVPYNMLVANIKFDTTTYDNIGDYFTPDLEFTDDGVIFSYKKSDDNYVYKTVETVNNVSYSMFKEYTLNNISTMWSGYMANAENHCLAIKLPKNDTTAYFTIPFNDTSISSDEIIELDFYRKFSTQYSSFNEYIILPTAHIDHKTDMYDFAFSLQSQEKDSSNVGFNSYYDLMLFSPCGAPSLNKNFKYHITFDQSLVGVRTGIEFDYTPKSRSTNNSTNITQNILDIKYERETDIKINGFVLLDTNITEYIGSEDYINDTTTIIESENYFINRQHVPPPRYLSQAVSYVYDETWNNVLNFTDYNNVRHVKILHHNHTQSKYNNNIKAANRMTNTATNEFLVEFSGYNEVVEL